MIDKTKRAALNEMAAQGKTAEEIAARLSVNVAAVRKSLSSVKMQRPGLVDETRPQQPQDD